MKIDRSDLQNHKANINTKEALMKLINLEQKLLNQEANFTSSVHKLKNLEESQVKKQCCCKGVVLSDITNTIGKNLLVIRSFLKLKI